MNRRPLFGAAKNRGTLDLFVYDEIGAGQYGDGVTPESVRSSIKNAGLIDSITVHLNSPGGNSFDGVTIHNILRQQGVPITSIVEGLAASAAFTIAMAGDKVLACDGSMLMLHNAWSVAIGNAADIRQMANLLDKVSGTLCDIYSKCSGMSTSKVQAMMDEEKWMTAEEAIDFGFATEKLDTTPEKSAEAKALASSFALLRSYANTPKALKDSAATDDLYHRCLLRLAEITQPSA